MHSTEPISSRIPKFLVLVVTSAALSLALAGQASALCSGDSCGGGGGGGGDTTPTETHTLTVTPPGTGAVTASFDGSQVINCTTTGSDCSQTFTYVCDVGNCTAPTVTLTASRSGYTPAWSSNCTVPPANAMQCSLSMSADRAVSLTWQDTQAPTVSLDTAPARVGPETPVVANASDNDRVQYVDFYVDGVFIWRDTGAGDGWRLLGSSWVNSYGNNTVHTVTARAGDRATNQSNLSAGQSTTVDNQVGVALAATPVNGSYLTAPSFGFTAPDPDTVTASTICAVWENGSQILVANSCGSPFAPSLADDGQYEVRVTVFDDVGNIGTAQRSFTLDRAQPALGFTDGPPEGAVVGSSSFTYAFAASDSSPLTVQCALDGGAYGACTSATSETLTGVPAGSHALHVRARDAAGNESVITRNFAVPQPQGSGAPTGQNVPDGSVQAGDTRAPGVQLSAKAKQRLKSKAIVVAFQSDEGGIASAKAMFGKSAVATLSKTVTAGNTKLKLKLSKKAQKALAKALKRKKTVSIKVVVTVRDLAGNAKPVAKTVKLTR